MNNSLRVRTRLASVFALSLILLTGCAPSVSAEGEWGYPDSQGKPSLLLGTDGKVSGTDGCNRLIGNWSQSGDTVTFSELASTLMACQGVDEWLKDATTAKVTSDSLAVFNSDGNEIGQLPKAD